MKRKTRTREHKDLQNGQFGVLVKEAVWNRADIVIPQKPERKKGWDKRDEKGKQEHGKTKTYK